MMRVFYLDLVQSFRSAHQHAWQSVLSVIGIAVGTVCMALTANWLWTENNHDAFRRGYRDMYVLQSDSSYFGPSTTMPYAMVPQLDSLLGGKVPYVVTGYSQTQISRRAEDTPYEKTVLSVSPGIGEALNVKVLRGSLEAAVRPGANNVALTEHMARLIFGDEEALGKEVLLGDGYSERRTFQVAAVVEDCGTSNMYYDALTCLERRQENDMQWGCCNYHILLRTDDPAATLRQLSRIVQPKGFETTYSLLPLRTLHQSREHRAGGEEPFLKVNFYPLMFCFIAALLLLSAIVNLITIFTSIFLGRTREYALRRSLGGRRWQNARWICTSVVPLLLVAFAVGFAGLFVVLRFNPVLGGNASLYRIFAEVSLVTFAACLVGMSYPVWKLERAYRLSLGYGVAGHERSHAWLLVVQSFACALLLFVSLGMQRQLYAMKHNDMGFSRQNLLRLHTGRGWHPTVWNRDTQTQDLKVREKFSYRDIFWDLPAEIKAESAAVEDAIAMPFDIFNQHTGISLPLIPHTISEGDEERTLMEEWERNEGEANAARNHNIWLTEIPYAAFGFFRLKVDGELPRPQDEREGQLNVLLNDAARRSFHLSARGLTDYRTGNSSTLNNAMTTMKPGHLRHQRLNVCGWVDIHLSDYHNEALPTLLMPVAERHECNIVCHDAIYVRHLPGRRAEAEQAIRHVLARREVPEEHIIIESLDDYIAYSYSDEAFYARLISAISVLSVIITLSGVVSLLLYALRMRRRSIAIRRVHGATFDHLFRAHLVPFLSYTAAGAVPAFVPGYLLMRKWMEYFHYGTAPGLGLMAAILAAMLGVVLVIVFAQVKAALRAKPVEVLNPES